MKTREEMSEEVKKHAVSDANSRAPYVIGAVIGIKNSITTRAQTAATFSCRNAKITGFEITITSESGGFGLDSADELIKSLSSDYVDSYARTLCTAMENNNVKVKAAKIEKKKMPPDIKFFIEI